MHSAFAQLQGIDASIYGELPTDSSIRIIYLLPGNDNDPLEVELGVIDLNDEDQQTYDAISYAWGTSERSVPVNCHSEHGTTTLWITSNLASVFHRLRQLCNDIPLVLWADAICINQSTDEKALQERAKQVQMMNRIFSHANSVLADLGPEPRYCDLLISSLEKVMACSVTEWAEFENGGKLPSGLEHFTDEYRLLTSFGDLLSRQYFTRIWTLQECVLASQFAFMMGSRLYNGEWCTQALRLLGRWMLHAIPSSLESDVSILNDGLDAMYFRELGIDRLREIVTLRQFRQRGSLQDYSISKLIVESWYGKSTDPRDKFYALYGLASEIDEHQIEGIRIDYTQNVDILSLEVSKLFLESQESFLDLFTIMSGVESHLPSWCTDLKANNEPASERGLGSAFLSRVGLFSACRDTTIDAILNDYNNTINLSACIVDTILASGPTRPGSRTNEEGKFDILLTYDVLQKWNLEVVEWTENALFQLPKEMIAEMRWRTLCADSTLVSTNWKRATYETELCYQAFAKLYSKDIQETADPEDPEESWRKANLFGFSMMYSVDRKLAVTEHARLGLFPPEAVTGDVIAIISGLAAPFVLRRQQDGTYRFVGECYLYGMMDGEAFDQKGFCLSTITIS